MPYIGKSPSFGVRNRFVYLASSGATSVSGADANGATLTFTDGAYVDVYLNGVLLKPTTDYNTSTANTIAGLSALNTNDEVTVVVYDVFAVSDTVSAASGGTFSGGVTVGSTLDVAGNVSLDGGNFVFNESGAAKDFRIEGDTFTNLFIVDGSEDDIGMGLTPSFTSGNGLHLADDFKIGFGAGGSSRPDFQLGYTSSTDRLSLACGYGADTADIEIDTGARVGIGTAPDSNKQLKVLTDGASNQSAVFTASNASYATEVLNVFTTRAGNSAFALYKGHSNSNNDVEFSVRGDGEVSADGSFSGGGADYAEYFEWKDGNISDENRVGCSVVLDGNQIRKATSDDTASNIIGVVSANPAIVGDGDSEKWKQKYLRTDFGNYDLDENGDRKLNPKWDESKKDEYVSREDRKEWDTVGLMGKLRLLKGQPTGDRWIKMRDISDTVEEWLVR